MSTHLKNERLKTIRTETKDILQDFAKARRQRKLTQADVAVKMHTSPSAIARLEGGGGKKYHSPSLKTLLAYADVLDLELKLYLIPKKSDNQND